MALLLAVSAARPAVAAIVAAEPLLDAVSCAGPTFCASVGGGALQEEGTQVFVTDPTRATAWRSSIASDVELMAQISCPAIGMCVVAGGGGNVSVSTDLTTAHPTWTLAHTTGNVSRSAFSGNDSPLPQGISCSSRTFCVVVDSGGSVLTSDAPAKGARSWKATAIRGRPPFVVVSCSPGTQQCVAGDGAGYLYVTADADGGDDAWRRIPLATAYAEDDERGIDGVACPSARFCMALDGAGAVFSSADPSDPASWHRVGRASPYGAPPTGSSVARAAGRLAPAPHAAASDVDLRVVGQNRLSCPTTDLCLIEVAGVDADGSSIALLTANPTAAAPTWTKTRFDALGRDDWPSAQTCASASLCLVTTWKGRGLVSQAPLAGEAAWAPRIAPPRPRTARRLVTARAPMLRPIRRAQGIAALQRGPWRFSARLAAPHGFPLRALELRHTGRGWNRWVGWLYGLRWAPTPKLRRNLRVTSGGRRVPFSVSAAKDGGSLRLRLRRLVRAVTITVRSPGLRVEPWLARDAARGRGKLKLTYSVWDEIGTQTAFSRTMRVSRRPR